MEGSHSLFFPEREATVQTFLEREWETGRHSIWLASFRPFPPPPPLQSQLSPARDINVLGVGVCHKTNGPRHRDHFHGGATRTDTLNGRLAWFQKKKSRLLTAGRKSFLRQEVTFWKIHSNLNLSVVVWQLFTVDYTTPVTPSYIWTDLATSCFISYNRHSIFGQDFWK